ncbi:hypothetical protein DMN91_010837 [Ooceraea biroi]|uniref:Uncharacterized protein n=1 Tax=Ooceraea biroi TaxID=2015173 RepID=A0A026WZ66_OOCBI|nr:uncharacterized protein LOC105274594 [Ooceraea biroi]EZA60439.1 hypothetical protein X777_13528 [Ooceraea biroi]RLU16769.1 hypothetical protein DMN91_010837 [Ooceraea biroi]
MSRAATHRDRPLWPYQIVFVLFILLPLLSVTLNRVDANPLPDLVQEYQKLLSESGTDDWTDNSVDNSTDNSVDYSTETAANTDVYVVKAVVYEIGILTDTDNTTSGESTERQERVDISLYDPPRREDEFS